MGIVPTRPLIEAYMKSLQAEGNEQAISTSTVPAPMDQPAGTASPPEPQRYPRGYSKSLLEPILQEQGSHEKPLGKRKPGRPRIVASWFERVAYSMRDGTSLRTALRINGLTLSKSEIRACYRNTTLRALYTEARRHYLIENRGQCMKRISLEAVLRELGQTTRR